MCPEYRQHNPSHKTRATGIPHWFYVLLLRLCRDGFKGGGGGGGWRAGEKPHPMEIPCPSLSLHSDTPKLDLHTRLHMVTTLQWDGVGGKPLGIILKDCSCKNNDINVQSTLL